MRGGCGAPFELRGEQSQLQTSRAPAGGVWWGVAGRHVAGGGLTGKWSPPSADRAPGARPGRGQPHTSLQHRPDFPASPWGEGVQPGAGGLWPEVQSGARPVGRPFTPAVSPPDPAQATAPALHPLEEKTCKWDPSLPLTSRCPPAQPLAHSCLSPSGLCPLTFSIPKYLVFVLRPL